jgi:hypothetical protein
VGWGWWRLVAGRGHGARIWWRPGGMADGLAVVQPRKAARRAPSGVSASAGGNYLRAAWG